MESYDSSSKSCYLHVQDFQKYMKDRGVDVSKDRPRKALALVSFSRR